MLGEGHFFRGWETADLIFAIKYDKLRKLAFGFLISLSTVTRKIMYAVINFFFLGLSCSGKKGGKFGKIYSVEQASEH